MNFYDNDVQKMVDDDKKICKETPWSTQNYKQYTACQSMTQAEVPF